MSLSPILGLDEIQRLRKGTSRCGLRTIRIGGGGVCPSRQLGGWKKWPPHLWLCYFTQKQRCSRSDVDEGPWNVEIVLNYSSASSVWSQGPSQDGESEGEVTWQWGAGRKGGYGDRRKGQSDTGQWAESTVASRNRTSKNMNAPSISTQCTGLPTH